MGVGLVPAGQEDSAAEKVDRREGREGPIGEDTGGVISLAGIVIDVELHSHALADMRVAQTSAVRTQRLEASVLDGKGHAVPELALNRADLKVEVGGEGLHVDRGGEEGTCSLIGAAIG